MSKVALKNKIRARQNGLCSLSNVQLDEDTMMYDTDRINPKANGGTYTDKNTRVVNPVAHMKRHNSFRERDKEHEQLKILIDGRSQVMKLYISMKNRLGSEKRKTDHLDHETKQWLLQKIDEVDIRLTSMDKVITKHLKTMDDPIIKIALKVKGLGAITIAYMIVYVDISKARYASSLWKYVGYHKPSYKRYVKGESGGGNKTLRTALFASGCSMIRTRSIYRDVYDNEKTKLSASEKMVISNNTQGEQVECMWKDTKPCHRHQAAIRKMMKHFLADWWYVHRTISELPTPDLYVQDRLGHQGIVRPEERGWIY